MVGDAGSLSKDNLRLRPAQGYLYTPHHHSRRSISPAPDFSNYHYLLSLDEFSDNTQVALALYGAMVILEADNSSVNRRLVG